MPIEPSKESFRQFRKDVPGGQPIGMLNLLRFNERARYEPGANEPPRSGREAYAEYKRHTAPLLARVGAREVFAGPADCLLIAPEGEAWDEVLLVVYPSREAVLEMIGLPEYRAIAHHRHAALADSKAIASVPRL